MRRRFLVALAAASLVLLALPLPTTQGAFVATVRDPAAKAATNPYFSCGRATAPTADGATAVFVWPLTETAGTAADASGHGADGTYRGSSGSAPAGTACPRDPGPAYRTDGSTAYVTSGLKLVDPTSFTIEVWFATTTPSGKLIGFGNAASGSSSQYDRHIYLTGTGRLTFGLYSSGTQTITSPNAYTDGHWHHVAATFSAATGARLYVDGALVAADPAITAAESATGYWRVGYDNQVGWPGIGSDPYFTGTLRYAAVYTTVLTAQQIAAHAAAGG